MLNTTTIQFIFIGNITPNFRIELGVSKITHFLNTGNIITIPNEIFVNDKYIELFDIFEGVSNNKIYNFRMSIYKKIVNYIHYDTTKNGLSSIEMIFFGKKNLPSQINYGEIKLSQFNNNKNKYRKRICFANIDPYDVEYLNDESFKKNHYIFGNDSYQIILRFAQNNSIKYSVSNISFQKQNYSDGIIYYESFIESHSEINLEKNYENKDENIWIDKEEIKYVDDFYSNYNIFLDSLYDGSLNNEEVQNYLSDDLAFLNEGYNRIKNKKIFQYLQDPFTLSDTLNDNKYIEYYFFLNEYNSIYNSGNTLLNFISLTENAIETNKVVKNFLNNLNSDKNLELYDKTKILKASSEICIKSILSKNSVNGIDYICIENVNNNHPYRRAVELISNIINHLDEDSRLFEAFLYFNSGTIENKLEKEKKIKYKQTNYFGEIICGEFAEYKTEFGLSLLNINQVKSHLKNLIPKYFIRIHTPINFRAYFSKETNLMVLNEKIIFNENLTTLNLLYKSEDSDKYIIPIVMEILHEMMSHGKIRIIDTEEMSPRYFRDSNNNFEYQSIFKICELESNSMEKIPIPESGKILEHFISNNTKIINTLKTPLKENTKFIDFKFWIGSNFDGLESEIEKRDKKQNLVGTKMLLDEFENDYIDDCYIDRGKKYII